MRRVKGHHPWGFNIILWGTSFIILLFAFSGNKYAFQRIDYIYTLCFLCTLMPPVFLNMYLLMPILLSKGRYVLFVISFIANLLVFTRFNVWFFSSFVDDLLPDLYFVSYLSEINLLFVFSIFLIVTMLLKLAEEGFYLQKKERVVLQIQKEKVQLELSLLRAQLQPHFLFNALNVVYALSLENKEKTTEAIVQLSEVLRYVIYDTGTEKVVLEKEVELLRNYINFQSNRTFLENICFDVVIDKTNYKISPMLLLPLVENAFKHGGKGADDFIAVEIKTLEGKLQFSIMNSYDVDREEKKGERSGVGIEAVKRNLELIYPQRYNFSEETGNGVFSITLKINLDEEN